MPSPSGNVWCDPDRPGVPVNPQNVWKADGRSVTRLGTMFTKAEPETVTTDGAVPEDMAALLRHIKDLGVRKRTGDAQAGAELDQIAALEYARGEGSRGPVRAALSATGTRKP